MDRELKNWKERINSILYQLPYIEEIIQSPQVIEDFRYIFQMGGKRVRPLLCIAVASAVSEDQNALPWYTACALECFHNFTLVHDDWMDQAPLRRGKKTLHELRSPSYAILLGDMLQAYTYLLITRDQHNANPRDSINLLSETSLRICEGQIQDILLEKGSLEDYMKMIELKTAALFTASLLLGLISSGKDDPDLFEKMVIFGTNMGIYFQLQDDIMDVFPPSDAFGKQIGGDIENRKKTILYFLFQEKADQKDKQVMNSYWDQRECPKEKIIQLWEAYQIQNEAYRYAHHFYMEARQVLDTLPPSFQSLRIFLDLVQNRVV